MRSVSLIIWATVFVSLFNNAIVIKSESNATTLAPSATTTLAPTTTIQTITTTTTSTLPSTTTTTATSTTTSITIKDTAVCELKRSSQRENELLNKVLQLKNQYTWQDDEHLYYFGVCTKAYNGSKDNEGLVQINRKTQKPYVIGRLADVDLEGLDQIIRIQYKNGDRYNNACNKAERTAIIYLVCNPNNSSEIFEMIEENTERADSSCGYIFQLKTPKMCTQTSTPAMATTTTTTTPSTKPHIGVLSITLIIAFAFVCIYFLVGTLYMRYVQQARGIEQVPHWQVWHAIGVKSTDCFNYACRCGRKPSEVRNYEHINDRLSDDDENLLNM